MQPDSPIEHVVNIVKENHTFDNYFGRFPGVNGSSLHRAPDPALHDSPHDHAVWLNRATGAVEQQYREADIPAYFEYARKFTFCDNYFTEIASQSEPRQAEAWKGGGPSTGISYRGTQFRYGPRVGCLVISPYAKKNNISRTPHPHASLVKFCEKTFGLPTFPGYDATADDMSDCFNFSQPPLFPPPANPGGEKPAPKPKPKSAPKPHRAKKLRQNQSHLKRQRRKPGYAKQRKQNEKENKMYTTDMYEGVFAETITMTSVNGDPINAYLARPLGEGPFPAMVLAHHMPGWDAWYREITFKFALHGYVTISPNLYFRTGHGTPEDIAAKVRADGGLADDQVVSDLAGAMKQLRSMRDVNGKVGVFGTCSGGRHAYLAACRAQGFDAVVDCWGGNVVMRADQLSPKTPVPPIDYTKDLSCPILGLFGNEDKTPSPEQVNLHEAELKKYGKNYEFHRYPEAGHGFFYYHRPNYRQAQAVDGWEKVFSFLEKNLT